MIYGVVGVPLALLTIADVGMFLKKFIKLLVKIEIWLMNCILCRTRKKKVGKPFRVKFLVQVTSKIKKKSDENAKTEKFLEEVDDEEEEDEEEPPPER